MKSEEYDPWFDSGPGKFCWSLERSLIPEMLALQPGETVLDVGCGTVRLLQTLNNNRAVGLDLSPAMLSRARKKGVGNLVLASAEALAFPHRSFDAVTLITVLEFVPDPEKVLREALRVCRGRLLLGVLNRRSLLYVKKRFKGIFLGTPYKEASFHTVRSLRRLVTSIAPHCEFRYKTTLALPLLHARAPRIERRLTEIGCPFGGFLVVSISRGWEYT